MFSLAETPVKFVGLLLLFTFCTLWSVYELTRPQDVRQRISNALHVVMAVVMLSMVERTTWHGLVAVVPMFTLVGLFAMGTAWFVWLAMAALDRRGGLHFFGHAAMFAAMTWHLSAMAVMKAAKSPGMGMGPGAGMGHGAGMGSSVVIVALIGLPLMVYLLVSSLRSAWQAAQPAPAIAADSCPCGPDCGCGEECSCRLNHADAVVGEPQLVASGRAAPLHLTVVPPAAATHSCSEVRPVGTTKYRLEALAAFAMNFGMFWMSTGLLVPILPFFAML